jgi:hypothetical protein
VFPIKKTVIIILLITLSAVLLYGCGETAKPVLDNAPVVLGVAAGAGVLAYLALQKTPEKESGTSLADQVKNMLTSTEAAVRALGFTVNSTNEGFTSTHTAAITKAAASAGPVTVQQIVDELAISQVKIAGATIEVDSFLSLINSFIKAAYQLKGDHATDSRLLLPLYIASDSGGNIPDSAPTLTASSTLSFEKAALLYSSMVFVAKYIGGFTTAAGVNAAGEQDLSTEIVAEITNTPVYSGSFGESASALVGAYAGSLVGLALATKASAALLLSTGPAAVPAIPYIYGGLRVTGAVIGNRVATFVYKNTLGKLGSDVTQAEIDGSGKVLAGSGDFVVNHAPAGYISGSSSVAENTYVRLTAVASDEDGSLLNYSWSCSSGGNFYLSDLTSTEVYFYSDHAGTYSVYCSVSDAVETTVLVKTVTVMGSVPGSMITVDSAGGITINNGLITLNVTAESSYEELVSNLPSYWKDGGVYSRIRGSLGTMKNRTISVAKDASDVAAYKVTYGVEFSPTQEAAVSWLFIVPADKKYAIWIATIESTGSGAMDLRYSSTGAYLALFYLEHEASYANEYLWEEGGHINVQHGPLNGSGTSVSVDPGNPWVTVYNWLTSSDTALTFGWLDWSGGSAPQEFSQYYEIVRARADNIAVFSPGDKKSWIGMFSIHTGKTSAAGQFYYDDAKTNYLSIIDLLK